jgi:hypothetical protein
LESATATKFKLIHQVKDDKFDVDNLHQYNLLLQVGPRDLQIAVVDSVSNQCLILEDYILASVKSYAELQSLLEEIFENHHLLTAGFWKKVRIAVKNNKFSLVPSSLFVKTNLKEYLSLNSKINPEKEELLYYKHIQTDAICVFAVNKQMYNWFKSLYPNTELGFIHQSSALIEGVINYASQHSKNSMYLYIDRFKLHLVTLKNNKLEYYNQFVIKEFSEYIKYIMLVMKGLQREQQTSDVVLWGYLGRESAHYNEFYKYIKNISFGDRPNYLKYGYVFDEVQDHQYLDLYSIHLCD